MQENELILEAMRACGINPDVKGAVKEFAEKIKVSAKTVTGWKNNKLSDVAEVLMETLIENQKLKRQLENSVLFRQQLREFLSEDIDTTTRAN